MLQGSGANAWEKMVRQQVDYKHTGFILEPDRGF